MILKWPGGKRRLLKEFSKKLPQKFESYIEPFLGGASFFFTLIKNRKSLLSDKNDKLIKTFEKLQKDPLDLFNRTSELIKTHSDEQFYTIRKKYNEEGFKAHWFLYLNRTCFNGMYRENLKGEFNVPVGRRIGSFFPFSEEDFISYSEALKNSNIQALDFRDALRVAKKGDFIYLDPPYINKDKDTFKKYNKKVFNLKDLEDLASEANRLKDKCSILISNFDVEFVREYFPDWNYESFNQVTTVSGKPQGRVEVKEALIHNM